MKRNLSYYNNDWGHFKTLLAMEAGMIDILVSESNDIMFNLATEEFLFEHMPIINPLLFLYRNDKSIIIGKH